LRTALRRSSIAALSSLTWTGVLNAQELESSSSEPAAATADLDQVLVTGSHIHGMEAAGSKLIVITRDQIDTGGYGRLEDLLSTVTQNFGRANEAVTNGKEVDNSNRGAEVQLRGLGLGTTLTLVNGQRQALSGSEGSFTDISTIPAAAIERIEILPEGASALYGSDAIGGVVNIILRESLEGLETRARAGTADGDARELEFSQFWGHAWSGGHALIGYQFSDRQALSCGAREVCAANLDFRPFGGRDYRGVGGNPGTILDPSTLLPVAAIPRGQDGTNLTSSSLIPGAVNYTDNVDFNQILPKQTLHNVFFSISRDLTSGWEFTADSRYASRAFEITAPQGSYDFQVPDSNAFNHLGRAVVVAYDLSRDFGPVLDGGPTDTFAVSTGIKGALPRGWQINMSAQYARLREEEVITNELNDDAISTALTQSDPSTAFNIFGDGSHTNAAVLATLRNQELTNRSVNVSTISSGGVIADGPLVQEAAGVVRLAVGADYRYEHALDFDNQGDYENRSRDVSAGFFEFAVPLAAPGPAAATAGRLDMSVAGRFERYDDSGSTFNPKLGLNWWPWVPLKLRGTWGTSFRAPPFFRTNPAQFGDSVVAEVNDPKSPTGQSRVLALLGPYPGVRPETASVWTAGLDATPPNLHGFNLSLTYFDIDYRGKIHNPGLFADFLSEESDFAGLITRNPTRAQIDAGCYKPTPGEQCNLPIAAIVDNRFRNLSSVRTQGLDAALDYAFGTSAGRWALGINGTYTFRFDQQLTSTSPDVDVVNTVGNPLKLRFAAHASWTSGPWLAQTTLNYAGRYQDPGAVPSREVDSWTTVDLSVGLRVEGEHGWLSHTRINLGVINVFNRPPPFVDLLGYDAASATLLGREISLQIVKGWAI
jgi:iron complex outermembrane recepter protein